MIFSFIKLKKLANLNDSVTIEEVVGAINSIGFEVESYEPFSDVEGIRFGHVTKVYKNPNADRLNVCEIEFADKNRIIQTNAQNVKENDYLMAFVPGSRSKKMVFGERVMQGINSEGMLVSLEELGFDDKYFPTRWYDGIFTFQQPIDLTLDPIQYFELNDYLIDVTILSNRADANCYTIMAKELAAYFDTDAVEFSANISKTDSTFSVSSMEETNFFTLTEINAHDIEISLQDQLFLIKHNIKTINNPTDLSNLTLLYTGVPTHAYDAEKLSSKTLSVKKYTGEIEILGKSKVVIDNALCVFDSVKPVSVAAVIGLENSSCDENTKQTLFELASFNLKEVRNSKKQVKLDTASSARASKEISNGSIQLAHNYIATKVKKMSEIINNKPAKFSTFEYDEDKLNRFAGFDLTATDRFALVMQKLKKIGIEIKDKQVYVPAYRYDLNTMQDFTEEVFRFYGYENFKMIQSLIKQTQNNHYKDYHSILKNMHYQNTRTFTLTSPDKNIFNPFNFAETINLQTFASAERTQIRHSMVPSLIEVLEYNQKRKIEKMSLFEIGMIQKQINVLSIVSNIKSFDQMKQDICEILDSEIIFERVQDKPFHPNMSALIKNKNNKVIGYLAKIHPEIINTKAICAELFLDLDKTTNVQFKNYKHDPLKIRDFNVLLNHQEDLQATLDKLNRVKGIHSIHVKDRFVKENGQVNTTISITVEDWAVKKIEQMLE
ncbi:phenylalanine--tRNA ligase subunit beta [Mycoplasma phocoenae]|uniref:Phenylalanine--tRNA ligase beta subunit n=1 Tax=Mycoplasma phocoenae TaxID=754517 RepID=A0A858U512_9MOLU|nr:phenylalanine--tRNA ligase subunit beta [Mycoplasma phocoenae]QJG67159.1 phenylalanine--tRNA ligase subunit beta [Mycoplasma phocoenae]